MKNKCWLSIGRSIKGLILKALISTHVKNARQRVNDYSMASIKVVGLMYAWRWEKRTRKIVE